MIFSMTGYGKTDCQIADNKVILEIRSLNSKQLDLSTRIAPQFREKELEIRALIAQKLERGKVDLAITIDNTQSANKVFTPINAEAFKFYYKQLFDLKEEIGQPIGDLLNAVVRFPDVMSKSEQTSLDDEDWGTLQDALLRAIDEFNAFRAQEGVALQRMFTEKLDGIADLLAQVEPFEKGRIDKIRQHLEDNLQKLSETTQQAIDKNRLEQEMIYYLEKLDITEEKVRLTNHIKYFRETMNESGAGVGKKLGFIAQEMGREINTLGSKSNQSEMQIIVVKMKDILEQIKEQVLNVL